MREAILRVGVDIGGTFTDVVFFDEDTNSVALAKALTTPVELARGVQDSLAKAAASVTLVGPEDAIEVNVFGHLVMQVGSDAMQAPQASA